MLSIRVYQIFSCQNTTVNITNLLIILFVNRDCCESLNSSAKYLDPVYQHSYSNKFTLLSLNRTSIIINY